MRLGYAKETVMGLPLEAQRQALHSVGCEQIYADPAGRAMFERERAIVALTPGAVLIVAEWTSAVRSLTDAVGMIRRIMDRQATMQVLDKPGLDLTTTAGQGFLTYLGLVSAAEHEVTAQRASVARRAALEKGCTAGARPKLSEPERQQALALASNGVPLREIAALYKVHHSTIARLR